ncbi:glycosyltransferase family 1 protein [Bradyrhizobium prioriisuperbiae]|uniref:glycosyltransferase family 4 protein n=1 Tax=Bradyrhizobium prioriisuperbiae TaxID=2854389 RepID=UPI0028E8C8B3|nr:glycosyltransferase family 1 protein [Bradyrhizobium prioritasuperba]
MTGIANYTFWIVRSLLEHGPSFRYVGFDRLGWREVNLASMKGATKARDEDNGRHVSAIPSERLPDHIVRLAAQGVRRLSYFRQIGVLYRAVYRRSFEFSLRPQQLDLFHAFNFRPPADPGVPVLPVVYDLSTFRHPEFHPADRVAWLAPLSRIVARAPMVQTISEFSKQEIIGVFGTPADQIFVAPPAAAALYRPIGQGATQRDLAPFDLKYGSFFLTVGTLEPRKNIRTLIAAYARLSPAVRSNCPLVVAGGKGWGSLDLPAQAESLRADATLRFLEGVNNPQLRSLYEGARLMLMPSLYEGFGMPVVEALACGTAVAHSADTSMDEISGGFGQRVAALDVDGWSDALREAIAGCDHDDPALRVARVAQARQFDWDRSAGLVLAAYRQLIPG